MFKVERHLAFLMTSNYAVNCLLYDKIDAHIPYGECRFEFSKKKRDKKKKQVNNITSLLKRNNNFDQIN